MHREMMKKVELDRKAGAIISGYYIVEKCTENGRSSECNLLDMNMNYEKI